MEFLSSLCLPPTSFLPHIGALPSIPRALMQTFGHPGLSWELDPLEALTLWTFPKHRVHHHLSPILLDVQSLASQARKAATRKAS